jgi:hypothetical protein
MLSRILITKVGSEFEGYPLPSTRLGFAVRQLFLGYRRNAIQLAVGFFSPFFFCRILSTKDVYSYASSTLHSHESRLRTKRTQRALNVLDPLSCQRRNNPAGGP